MATGVVKVHQNPGKEGEVILTGEKRRELHFLDYGLALDFATIRFAAR